MYEYSRDEMIFRILTTNMGWNQEYVKGLSDEDLYKEVRHIEERERVNE